MTEDALTIEPIEATLRVEYKCEHCPRIMLPSDQGAMFVMEPGADGKEWYLCWRCWWQGAERKVQNDEQPPAVQGVMVAPADPPRVETFPAPSSRGGGAEPSKKTSRGGRKPGGRQSGPR